MKDKCYVSKDYKLDKFRISVDVNRCSLLNSWFGMGFYFNSNEFALYIDVALHSFNFSIRKLLV